MIIINSFITNSFIIISIIINSFLIIHLAREKKGSRGELIAMHLCEGTLHVEAVRVDYGGVADQLGAAKRLL